MLGGVFHRQAQLATPLVHVQRARLEDPFLLAAVEIVEGNEIVAELIEVAMIAHQPLDGGDGGEFRLELHVLAN